MNFSFDKRKEQLASQKELISSRLRTLPSDDFYICHQGNLSKWFKSNKNGASYIPKKERPLAEKLAYRKYLLALLNDIAYEEAAISAYESKAKESKADKLLSDSHYIELIKPYLYANNRQCFDWNRESYIKNTEHPENLIHKSISGNILRSKSEAIIDMLLFQSGVQYRYECELTLDSCRYYPDFTILHPTTKELIYWEHFGLLDDADYVKHNTVKLQNYIRNGIIPGINLICTCENKMHPLSPDLIQRNIDMFLLQ